MLNTNGHRFILAWVGLACGLGAAVTALELAGAGHGFASPLAVCGISLALAPLAGVAWAIRHSRTGRVIGWVLVAVSALADVGLVGLTVREGVSYCAKVWHEKRIAFIIWLLFWAEGQVVALFGVLGGYVGKHAEQDGNEEKLND
jgi:hypothetical protein